MIVAGRTNASLAEAISDALEVSETPLALTKRTIKDFANGEIDVEIEETVAGAEIFLIQTSLTGQPNDNFMETLFMIDALKRARAKDVFLVQPIFPYERQDRRETNKKGRPKRKSVTARVIADCLMAVNLDGIISVELHSEQIEGFFNNRCIVENIDPTILFKTYLENEGIIVKNNSNSVSKKGVAPDAGAVGRVRDFSNMLGLNSYVIIDKNRTAPGENEVINVIGDCSDCDCFMYDDIVDTGGTAVKAAEALKNAGAKDIYLLSPHPVLSKTAVERLLNSPFKKIIVTDSIPNSEILKYPEKFVVLPLAELLANVITNIHNSESLQPIVNGMNRMVTKVN